MTGRRTEAENKAIWDAMEAVHQRMFKGMGIPRVEWQDLDERQKNLVRNGPDVQRPPVLFTEDMPKMREDLEEMIAKHAPPGFPRM